MWMSYMRYVLSLLSGVEDAAVRADVVRTVEFLRLVYITGRVPEEEIFNDLVELFRDLLLQKHPELTVEEATEKAREVAGELIREWRIGFRLRVAMERYGGRS